MIIDTNEMVIKSDDGVNVLNTISSVSIVRGANNPTGKVIFSVGQIPAIAENNYNNNPISRLTAAIAENKEIFSLKHRFPYVDNPNTQDENSVLNMLYLAMSLTAVVKTESERSKKLFKSKIYLLKNKSEIKRIKNKLKRHLQKDVRVDWNRCKETTALKAYKLMKGWIKQNGK